MFVTKASATDADEGINQFIEYSIVSGNIGDVFQINSKTVGIETLRMAHERTFFSGLRAYLEPKLKSKSKSLKTKIYKEFATKFLKLKRF